MSRGHLFAACRTCRVMTSHHVMTDGRCWSCYKRHTARELIRETNQDRLQTRLDRNGIKAATS